MTAPETVSPAESLARFVLQPDWIRADGTLRPDPFVPHPHTDLSVTRHHGLTPEELWELGENVAAELRKKRPSAALLGRGDFQASLAFAHGLQVKPHEPPRNHANVEGFPKDNKPLQKSIAQRIVAEAKFVRVATAPATG